MKRIKHIINLTIYILTILLSIAGCEKDTEPSLLPPSVYTGESSDITRFEAELWGTVTPHPKAADIQENKVSFIYSNHSPNLLENVKTVDAVKAGTNEYNVHLTELEAGKTYYYCIVTDCGKTSIKGEIKKFNTISTEAPSLEVSTNGNTEYAISLTGNVTDDGGATIDKQGFVYKLYSEGIEAPTTENGTNVPGNTGVGKDFYAELTELQPETTYIIRAYATNSASHTGYSEAIQVTTGKLLKPTVNTGEATDLTAQTVLFHGTIVSDNGYEISECGFCYSSESQSPTIDHPYVKVESITKEFSAKVEKLESTKTYYFRAYARNEKGIAYGEVKQCTMPEVQSLTVTAPVVTDIMIETAHVTASVHVPEGSSVFEKGVCYSPTVLEPTTNETTKADPSSGTDIALSLDELQEGTLYNVRAYAISRDGTFYSSTTQFTTIQTQKPEITAPEVSNITTTSASLSSHITSDGGASVETKGICYSQNSQNPTIDNSAVDDTSEGNNIQIELDDLEEGMTYYTRAYARNKNGISYSNTTSFKTTAHYKPVLSGLTAITINDDNATMQATLTDDGGLAVTECGFCWSENSSEPDIDHDSKVKAKTSSGTFEAKLTGLKYSTEYHIRAYAINEKGISYSGYLKITTKSSTVPTLVTLTTSNITPSTVDVAATVTADGGAEITERGFCYSIDSTPDADHSKKVVVTGGNAMSTVLNELSAYTHYKIRAYARNKNGVGYSNTVGITTKKKDPGIDDSAFPDKQ